MSKIEFNLKPVEGKPPRRYRKRSKYDSILDKFIEGTENLVEVTVEGMDANYLRTQLNNRIEAKNLKDMVKASVVKGVCYLEKL